MKKNELEKMISYHTARHRYLENELKRSYQQMAEEQQDRWLNDLLKNRLVLDWLLQQKPDDE
jgi:hypothetical protein